MRNIALALAALFAITSLSGCKDGDEIVSGFVIPSAAFDAEPPTGTASDFVTLEPSVTDGGTIVLDVVLHDVDESVSGIALKLTYPPDFSKFIGCTDGDLFTSGGCFAAEPVDGTGELFIGRSAGSAADATVVTGDHVVVRLEFLVFSEGTGSIVFEGQNLGGSDASAVLDTNGEPIFMNWFSGTLTGSR